MSSAMTGLQGSLNGDTFMKLFLTQMKHQDPTKPMKPDEMMSQLAELSVVEQTSQLNSSFESLLQLEQLATARDLLGRNIRFLGPDGEPQQGVATEAVLKEGAPGLMVGEQFVAIGDVTGVSSPQ